MIYSLIVKPSGHSQFAAYVKMLAGGQSIMNGLVAVRHIPLLVAAVFKLNAHDGDNGSPT